MIRRLPLLPLLVIPALSAHFVFEQGIVEFPWLEARYTMETLPEAESFTMTSKHTGSTYRIYVQLPHSYVDSDDRYPVFYAIDGPPAAPIYEEMILPLLRKRRIPETIFIGVVLPSPHSQGFEEFARILRGEEPLPQNRATDRTRQLSFDVDQRYGADGSGQGEELLEFFRDELLPEIDRRYRTKRDDRGIGGYDLGGLFAVSASISNPRLFQRVIAIAPQVHWGDYALIARLRQWEPERRALVRMYLGVGEVDSNDYLNGWQMLADLLKESESPGLHVQAEQLAGYGHRDVVVPAAQSGLSYVYRDAR